MHEEFDLLGVALIEEAARLCCSGVAKSHAATFLLLGTCAVALL